MTRVATPENEALLLSQAKGTTGAELERICARFAKVGTPRVGEEYRNVRRRRLAGGTIQI